MTNNTDDKTDHHLQTSVHDEYKWTPEVDAAHIGVSTDDAVVTPTGTVDWNYQRDAAIRAATRIAGVLWVDNSVEKGGADRTAWSAPTVGRIKNELIVRSC